jgi:RecA-family ATPase
MSDKQSDKPIPLPRNTKKDSNQNEITKDRLKVRKQLEENDYYIVSPIFPCGALHLVTGDSGMGKSSFLLPVLYDWSLGNAVLGGMVSHPCEWVYISMDRSLRDLNRTLRRIGLGDWDIPAYPIEELCNIEENTTNLIAPTIEHIVKQFPNAKLFVLEGLQTILPNTSRGQNQNKAESLWMLQLRSTVLNRGITIIATEHIPKGNDSGPARSKRNKALGSAALIGACGTVVTVSFPDSTQFNKTNEYTNERVVHVTGPNFADITMEYTRDEAGRFILEATRSGIEVYTHATDEDLTIQIDAQLSAWASDKPVTTTLLTAWGRVTNMSDSQLYRWTRKQVTCGRLEQIRKGEYRKVLTQ